jgi:Patatin-like phospholipase
MTEPDRRDPPREVLEDEWRTMAARRRALRAKMGADADLRALPESLKGFEDEEGRLVATQAELVGLALSGGGIRAATFSLGVVQGLEKAGVLPFVDLLSTVSGGGWTGTALTTLLRQPTAGPFPLARDTPQGESPALAHMRDNSSFTIPNGLVDTLRATLLVGRGLLLTTLLWLWLPLLLGLFEGLLFAEDIRKLINEDLSIGLVIGLLDWSPWMLLAGATLTTLGLAIPGIEAGGGRLSSRDKFEQAMTILFVVSALVFLVEIQPLIIAAVHQLVSGNEAEWALTGGVAGFGAAGAAQALLRAASSKMKLVFAAIFAATAVTLIPGGVMWAMADAVANSPAQAPTGLWVHIQELPPQYWVVSAVSLLVALYLDANNSSLHGFYRDRISHAFQMRPDGKGGVTDSDGLYLSETCPEGSLAPLHLVNVAMNLPGVRDLGLRGRNGDFFVLARDWSGSERTGWIRTKQLEAAMPRLDLATAIAISAAAASPNMGSYTMGVVRPLLTLLNVRMGVWIPHPARASSAGGFLGRWWRNPGPLHLLHEMLGTITDSGRLINVSDGGHLSNSAILELVRRRCRVIFASDAENDTNNALTNLSETLHQARVELGIEIEMDIRPFTLDDKGLAKSHVAVGTIRYPQTTSRPKETGVLVYIKSGMSGDEDGLLRSYRSMHADFPYTTTANQFFDDRRFEAYRALGEHSIEGLVAGAPLPARPTADDVMAWVERLRLHLAHEAGTVPGAESDSVDVNNPDAKRFLATPLPDLPGGGSWEEREAALREAASQLGRLSNAFQDLNLADPAARSRPAAEGALARMQRAAASPRVRWAAVYLLPTLDGPFQTWCIEELGLGGTLSWRPGDDSALRSAGLDDGQTGGEIFIGSLAEAGQPGLDAAWLRVEVDRWRRKVSWKTFGFLPGFSSTIRTRLAMVAARRWLGDWLKEQALAEGQSDAQQDDFVMGLSFHQTDEEEEGADSEWAFDLEELPEALRRESVP